MKQESKTQQAIIQGYTDQGAWLIATVYAVDDLVANGGTDYVCIVAHTSVAGDEPGVGADWEDFWEVLSSTTDAFEMAKYSGGIFHMPGTWDAADIGFQVAVVAAGPYLPLYDGTGTLVAITPAVDRSYALPSSLSGAKYVKLWSNSAGTDVHQAADRTIGLDFKT